MQNFPNHAREKDGLRAMSWFCVGLVFIAVVAGIVWLL